MYFVHARWKLLCDIFWTLVNSLVCWFCAGTLGVVLFQIMICLFPFFFQVEQDASVNDASPHIVNIGRMVEVRCLLLTLKVIFKSEFKVSLATSPRPSQGFLSIEVMSLVLLCDVCEVAETGCWAAGRFMPWPGCQPPFTGNSFDPQEMGEASASREDTVYVFITLWECQQMLHDPSGPSCKNRNWKKGCASAVKCWRYQHVEPCFNIKKHSDQKRHCQVVIVVVSFLHPVMSRLAAVCVDTVTVPSCFALSSPFVFISLPLFSLFFQC